MLREYRMRYPPSRTLSHKVILPVLGSVLVTRRLHVLLREQLIVRMILLVFLLLPLLCLLGLLFLACLVCGLIASANLLETVLALLLQIRLLLHLGLVEAVDTVVLPLRNEDTLDLALVLEAYLPHVPH